MDTDTFSHAHTAAILADWIASGWAWRMVNDPEPQSLELPNGRAVDANRANATEWLAAAMLRATQGDGPAASLIP
jgi:hypothetical protein